MLVYSFNIIVKKRISIALMMALPLLMLQSCNAFFEKDITDNTPEVIIPTDNDTILSNKIHFKWIEMEGASFYNLQIVKPSFSDISEFVLDSNINGEEFYQILEPGNYEYQIRGENGGYQSQYAGPFAFYVDSVLDLSTQFVSLVSPADGIYINGTENLGLSWQNLFAADQYEYILKIGSDFETGSILDQNLNINTLSYIVSETNFDVEGTYFWGVRGTNTNGSSAYSSRQINVDLTRPNDPELLSPIDEAIVAVTDPVVFKWTTGSDPGDVNAPVSCTIEISESESFIDFIEITGITADSLEYSFSDIGTYHWRVKSEDGAGNVSEFYSFEREITLE